MSELFYPTIDLFIYDLRSPLNASQEEIEENLRSFQGRLPENIQLKDIEKEVEYLELAPEIEVKPVNTSLEKVLSCSP